MFHDAAKPYESPIKHKEEEEEKEKDEASPGEKGER